MRQKSAVASAIAVWLLVQPALAQEPSYPPPEKVRQAFRKLLERPKVDLKPEFQAQEKGGLIIETGSFFSEAGERVPTLIMKQAGRAGRRPGANAPGLPAVVCLHGTGGSKESQALLLEELAGRGYLAVAIDARYHGERVPGGAKRADQYNDAAIRSWRSKPGERQEHPFWYDTAYDLWRTVDYLASRRDVDPDRLGMIGFSMGGIQIWLAASVDTRVKASVPAIAVQSMRWSLENDRWQTRARTIWKAHEAAAQDLGEPAVNERVCRTLWNKIVPGILDEFDCPSMIRLFAPRPMLILSGEDDPYCPLPGAKLAFRQAEAAYRAAGAIENLKIVVASGVGHRVTPEQMSTAHQWLDRVLKH